MRFCSDVSCLGACVPVPERGLSGVPHLNPLRVGSAARVAVQWLRTQAFSSGKVAAIGFCMGGRTAFLAAARGDTGGKPGRNLAVQRGLT
jgi:dienelactone hydrolase